jgi:hypothetical protein
MPADTMVSASHETVLDPKEVAHGAKDEIIIQRRVAEPARASREARRGSPIDAHGPHAATRHERQEGRRSTPREDEEARWRTRHGEEANGLASGFTVDAAARTGFTSSASIRTVPRRS